ncbi:hypothetical protein VTO73DRAFT_1205 [Trametes versicolor]
MDDSMTSEVVKLMLDELERVRCRNREFLDEIQAVNTGRPTPNAGEPVDSNLHALQQDNARLKAEVEAARIRLENVLGHDRDGDEAFSIDNEGEGLAEDLANFSKATAAGAAEAELADRVKRAHERYKRYKSSKFGLEEAVLETQNRIDETAAERQRELQQLQQLQEELQQVETQSPFDLVDFLRNPMPDNGSAEPMEEDIPVPSMFANANTLPHAIAKLCSRGFVMRRGGEVVWPSEPPSRTHCLSFSSTHRYDPKAHKSKGGWELSGDMRAQEENTKEVFHLTAQKWFYAGTYRCEKQTILPLSEISVLTKNYKLDLQHRAVMYPVMVAPILVKMMKDMYDCGALKIVCTGWRRVGFNHNLADALKSLGDTTTVPGRAPHQPHPSGSVINVPRGGLRSGKRWHSEEVDTAPMKKHKK